MSRGPFAVVPRGAFLTLVEAEDGQPAQLHLVWGASGDITVTLCGEPGLYIGEPNPDYAGVTARCPLCALVAAGIVTGHSATPTAASWLEMAEIRTDSDGVLHHVCGDCGEDLCDVEDGDTFATHLRVWQAHRAERHGPAAPRLGQLWASPSGDEFHVIGHGAELWLARPVSGMDLTGWALAAGTEGQTPLIVVSAGADAPGHLGRLANWKNKGTEPQAGPMVTAVSYQYGEYGEDEQYRVYTVPAEDYRPGMPEADAETAAIRPFTWQDAPGYRGPEPVSCNKDPQPERGS